VSLFFAHVLGLWMEETASSYGGYLRMYCISSRVQLTRGGPPAFGVGEGLAIPHRKKPTCYEMLYRYPRGPYEHGNEPLGSKKWRWLLASREELFSMDLVSYLSYTCLLRNPWYFNIFCFSGLHLIETLLYKNHCISTYGIAFMMKIVFINPCCI
jgi:hypothetical protein